MIVGAGIAAMQAGMILAHYNQDFVILEATSKIGGRIATDRLGDVVEEAGEGRTDLGWLQANKEAMDVMVDYGATWVSKDHSCMLRMLREFGIQTFPQYFDGMTIYGIKPGKYSVVESLIDYYKNYKK